MSTSLYQTSQDLNPRTEIHRKALAYAGKGFRVFPCRPAPDKSPLTRRGFKDATTAESRVHAFWNAHPGASIGVPTGEKFWVLDVDDLEAQEKLSGELPDTWTVRTPSGGLHLYFQAEEGITNSPGGLPKGIDVRGTGGYVLVPPSDGYTVENRAQIAEAPEWLLAKLREPKKSPERVSKNQRPTPIAAGGEPIPYGQRNDTLYRTGCSLRARGYEEADILAELEAINAAWCTPPLGDLPEDRPDELQTIARQAARHPKGSTSQQAGHEALEGLEQIENAYLWGRKWKGPEWKTPRSVVATLIQEGRAHSRKVKDAVRVSISVRALALAAGVSKQSLSRKKGALNKLEDAGIIRRVEGSGTKSGAFDLLIPQGVAALTHSSTEGGGPSSGSTLPHPPTGPRLRYSKPVYETVAGVSWRVDTVRRLSKSAEEVVDILERQRGWMSVPDLGDALGLKNHRDLRRRALPRLAGASVVEWSGDNVRLRLDWLSALNRKREEDEEIADYERDRKRYKDQGTNYRNKQEARKLRRRGLELEEIVVELNRRRREDERVIGLEDVRRHLGVQMPAADEPAPEPAPVEVDGLIEELEPVEDEEEDTEDEGMEAPELPTPELPEPELPELSALAVAVRDFLDRNPRRAGEQPSWIGNYLWSHDLYPGKPSREEIAGALEELGGDRYRREVAA